MIKISRFFKRLPVLTAADFSARWQSGYGEALQALAAQSDGVIRYAQSHVVAQESPIANAPESAFDGVDELWCDSIDSGAALFDSERYREELAAAEQAFVDPAASMVVVGKVLVMWDRPSQARADAVKLVILPARKTGLTVAEFRHHWIHVHSPLSLQGPGMRERVQRIEFCPGLSLGLAGLSAADAEGTGSIWFDNMQHLRQEFGSAYYRDTLQPDEKRFSDSQRSRGSMLHERLLWQRSG